MSILDDAIREHLELKRAHGADEAELQRLENEAFGPAERPGQASETIDPFAEAPTEFLTTPGAEESGGRRMPNIADLQEAPPEKPAEAPEAEKAAPPEGESAEAPAAEETEGVLASDPPAAGGLASDEPAVEEHPAMEHEAVAQPSEEKKPAEPEGQLRPDPGAPSSEERHEIAEQPTQMFDVEQQLFEDTAQSASPSDEQLIDAERAEPKISPVPEDEPADEFDEFFSEQRLSDELNQALEAPLPDEPSDEYSSPFMDPDAELGGSPDQTVEQPLPEDSREHELPSSESDDAPSEEHEVPAEDYQPHDPGHADALEDKPDFLEDEDDEDAWFEQKPPKDFDFGD
jgi:hypothetical protein